METDERLGRLRRDFGDRGEDWGDIRDWGDRGETRETGKTGETRERLWTQSHLTLYGDRRLFKGDSKTD